MRKIFFIAFMFIGFACFSQDQTLGRRTNTVRVTGKMVIDSGLVIPSDTTSTKCGIAQIGIVLYVGNCQYWTAVAGTGTVIIGNGTIDSITYTPTTTCSWFNGVSTCQDFSLLVAYLANSADGTRTNYYNLVGDSLGTKDNPHTDLTESNNFMLTNTGTNAFSATAGPLMVSDLTTLQSVSRGTNGTMKTAFVTDATAGGLFKYSSATLTDDGGITLPAAGGGHWVRDISQSPAISAAWFGLVNDSTIDQTATLSALLNSIMPALFIPEGTYLFNSGTITVNSAVAKKITGGKNTKFKINLSSSIKMFDFFTNVSWENIQFDLSNSYCGQLLYYRGNIGIITIKNCSISNLDDISTTTESCMINVTAQGNGVDISGIKLSNLFKRGNFTIGDTPGNLTGIFYGGVITTDSAMGGTIEDIEVRNCHNKKANGDIYIEDVSDVYVVTLGKKANVFLKNIRGYDFGKRLIKSQSSNVWMSDIYGESFRGDALGVIFSFGAFGAFKSNNVTMTNVTTRGNIDYPIGIGSANTVVTNPNINTFGYTALNTGANHYGIYFGDEADSCQVIGGVVTAKRPIAFDNLNGIIRSIKISGGLKISCPDTALSAITQSSNYGVEGLYIENVTATFGEHPYDFLKFIQVLTSFTGRNKDWHLTNINIAAKDSVAPTFSKSGVLDIKRTDGVFINGITYNNASTGAVLIADPFIIENCTKVDIYNVSIPVPSFRTIGLKTSDTVRLGKLNLKKGATGGDIVSTTITQAEFDPTVEEYNHNSSSQAAGEILRSQGTTAQLPLHPYLGHRYFNTTTSNALFWDGSAYVDAVAGTVKLASNQTLTGNNTFSGTSLFSNTSTFSENVARATFTGSTEGNVRIKNTSGTGNYTFLDFGNAFAPQARIGSIQTSSGSLMKFGTSNSYLSGITGVAMTINYNQLVGIGTETPDSTLHLVGTLKLDIFGKGANTVLSGDANGGAVWKLSPGFSTVNAYTNNNSFTENVARATFTGTTNSNILIRNTAGTGNYTFLDFGNTTIPESRIGSLQSASGSSMHFGISNSYGSGITKDAMVIDYTGYVGIGSTSPASILHVVETSTVTPRGILADQYNTGTQGSRITMRKARGTLASPTTIVTGDVLGSWTTAGHDGTGFIDAAKILVTSTGTIGTNIIPTFMDLQTMNAAGTLTTGLSISAAQAITLPALNSTGIVHNSAAGLLSTSLVSLTADVSGLLGDANISSAATWNAKQTALSGTGLLSFSGTTPSYNTTSASIAGIISDELGSGKMIFSAGTLDVVTGKTFTSSNTLTLAGTDGSTLNVGTGGTLGTAAYTATALLTVSSAGTLTLTHNADYVFSGTTTTWTLPAIDATKTGRAQMITIKNRGSGAITVLAASGATIWDLNATNSILINPGQSAKLMPDGTYFNVEIL